MNPMDAAWSVLKADPEARMRFYEDPLRGFPQGTSSSTMHPAIAGMMQGIGEGRQPISRHNIALTGPFSPSVSHGKMSRTYGGERGTVVPGPATARPSEAELLSMQLNQQTSPAPPPADPEFMARIKADEEESQRRKTEREERKD